MQKEKGTSSTRGLGSEGFLDAEQVSLGKLFSVKGQRVHILGFALQGLNLCSALWERKIYK